MLASTAAIALLNRPVLRHSITSSPHTARIAAPLSRRALAMVLKSGASRPVSHKSSTSRPTSLSSRRLDWMLLR